MGLKRRPNKIKKLKKQLTDRINQCKSIPELEGWKRTFSYHQILKEDQDWDYRFLLDLIEFKLQRMSQYFHTHRIVVNEDRYGTICDKLIRILHAGYKTDIIEEKDLHTYVNTRNVHRFIVPGELSFIVHENLRKYYLPSVREAKAKALFWKYLEHHIEVLWD